MSLLCFTLVGILAGWLAAILARIEDGRGIRRLMGLGFLGAQFAGLFANNWAFLGGLSVMSFGASVSGAIVLAAIGAAILRRSDVSTD